MSIKGKGRMNLPFLVSPLVRLAQSLAHQSSGNRTTIIILVILCHKSLDGLDFGKRQFPVILLPLVECLPLILVIIPSVEDGVNGILQVHGRFPFKEQGCVMCLIIWIRNACQVCAFSH